MTGVEYQVTKVDPTDPETKGMVYQVHKVSEEVAATLGGKVYRARIVKNPSATDVAGKVYQIVLIGDPDDPSVKGKVYNAILTGGSEAVIVGPAVSPLALDDAVADTLTYVKAFGGTEQNGTPTPDTPMDIVSNNGVLKLGKPITIDQTRNYAYINTTGSWAWSPDSYSIALPVEVGQKYKINITDTTASVVGTIFRYGFVDEDPEDFKQNVITPSSVSIPMYDYWRGTPQDLPEVEVTATHPYLVVQFAAAYTATVVSTYMTIKKQVAYADGTVETIAIKDDQNATVSTATCEDLLSVGTYTDEQEIISGNVTRKVGIKVLDGTETFTIVNNTFRYTLYGLPMDNKVMCNYFDGNVSPSVSTSNQPDLTIKGNANSNSNVYFKYAAKTTIGDFQQWLADQYAAGTPVIVVYPLATPTTESVAGQTLQVQDGDNTLEITQASIDGLQLEAEYEKEAE